MLQLTKRTEYGLIALTHLAGKEGEVTSVREISDSYPIPKRLLAEVLKELCRSSFVASHRGVRGGYSLARSPDAITIGEVVGVLEGHPTLASCESLGAHLGERCGVERVCPIKSPIHRLRRDIWDLFDRTTLRDLVSKRPLPAQHA
jgi:Rrf2 family protein